ncbi:MAG: hypothetical protein JTT11_05335 [Candidatus Brockarchaeota archaeon]|nr:hypothetical protein [Candidatus Brockarchaeota archaeon]
MIVEKIPWAQILVLTVVISFLGPIHTCLQPNAAWYALGSVACKLVLMVLPLILIMAVGVLGKLMGRTISMSYYTYLYSMSTALLSFTSYDEFPIGRGIPHFVYDVVNFPPEVLPWSTLLVPPVEAVQPMISGGAPVQWGAWLPAIVWWGIFFAACGFFALGWGVIWRRRWIDVEKVPFPHTQVAIDLIEKSSSKKPLKERLGLPFIVALALGIAYQIPLLLTYMYPWFPDIYGWRTNTCLMGTYYLDPSSPLAQVAGFAQFNKNPVFVAILYMAPLNVLLGGWVWYIVFVVLVQIAYQMGYYSGILEMGGCGRVWCGTQGYRIGEPYKWDVFTTAGVTVGIFISYVFLNRQYVAETFNAAIGKLSKERTEELDRSEPMSYRNAYAMIAASAILIIATLMAVGSGIVPSLTMIIFYVIVNFVQVRTYALVGYVAPCGSTYGIGWVKTALGTPAETTDWYVSTFFSYGLNCQPVGGGGNGFALLSSLSSYQMANAYKVSTKNVFKIQLLVAAIAPIISVAGTVWAFYTFGQNRMPSAGGWSLYEYYSPTALARRPAYDPWWPHMIAGILFAIGISAMHARFVWFPFEVFGFLLATDGHALIEGLWTVCLAAWVLKTITLKIGGSKLYESTGISAATGFVVGVVISCFIGGILFVIRFFVPF